MRKLIRKILKGASLTTALFIFEACYGSPHGDLHYEHYRFTVLSEDELSPIPGVDIMSKPFKSDFLDWSRGGTTDSDGNATVCAEYSPGQYPQFLFTAQGETYQPKDTVIMKRTGDEIIIKLSKKSE